MASKNRIPGTKTAKANQVSATEEKPPMGVPEGEAKPKPIHIENFGRLIELASEDKILRFELNGKLVELVVRPLNGNQQVAADKIDAIVPPRKPVKEGSKEEEFDYENPVYQEKVQEAARRKKAFIIACAVPALGLDSSKLDDVVKKVYSLLQTGVIDALVSAVVQITRDPVEHAVFI